MLNVIMHQPSANREELLILNQAPAAALCKVLHEEAPIPKLTPYLYCRPGCRGQKLRHFICKTSWAANEDSSDFVSSTAAVMVLVSLAKFLLGTLKTTLMLSQAQQL